MFCAVYHLYESRKTPEIVHLLSLIFKEAICWQLGQRGRNRFDSVLPIRDCPRSVNSKRRMSSTIFSGVFVFSPPLPEVYVPSAELQNDALLPPRGGRSMPPKSAVVCCVSHDNLPHCYVLRSSLMNWEAKSGSGLTYWKPNW